MITRDEAGEAIYQVINSGLLDEGIESDLEDICTCILSEKDGIHLWGADDKEVSELYTSLRSDLVTDEYMEHMNKLYLKYAFEPAEFEKQDFEVDIDEEDIADEEKEDTKENKDEHDNDSR